MSLFALEVSLAESEGRAFFRRRTEKRELFALAVFSMCDRADERGGHHGLKSLTGMFLAAYRWQKEQE